MPDGPERIISDKRQAYPIGDVEHGQFIQADKPIPTQENKPDWQQEEPLTVSTGVVQLNQAFRTSNNYCYITVEDAAIRYWIGGRIPTAAIGHPLEIGDILVLENSDELNDVQFIRRDGADSTLHCSFGNR